MVSTTHKSRKKGRSFLTRLLVRERLPQVVHGEPELLLRDESVPISVEDPEGVRHVLFDLGVPSQHHLDEFVEVDGPVRVLVHITDHVSQLLVSGMEAVVAHHAAELVEGDLA